jgi:hypothetical protein
MNSTNNILCSGAFRIVVKGGALGDGSIMGGPGRPEQATPPAPWHPQLVSRLWAPSPTGGSLEELAPLPARRLTV